MPQGPIASTIAVSASGKALPGTLDPQSNLGIAQAHGAKYNAAYNKRLFGAANPSGVTTSIGLATTYLGLCLSNPAGSKVNLSVGQITGQFIVAPSTVTGIGLIVGWAAGGITVHTTPITTLQSAFIGNAAVPNGLVDSACTLVGTPAWYRYSAETLVATDLPSFVYDAQGGIVIPPGGYIAIGTTIAGPASGFAGSIEWEEIPV